MGCGWLMSSMVYGDLWRAPMYVSKYFHPSNTQFYRPYTEFIRKMLPRLLDAPAVYRSGNSSAKRRVTYIGLWG
ncbi:hypothetical protein BYT27DRAFT_6852937 [Phlegmacium glaucopus]|nr:hypothetical protein BYT27DRAFT_6852937 [Phlegmacium glaucopus]